MLQKSSQRYFDHSIMVLHLGRNVVGRKFHADFDSEHIQPSLIILDLCLDGTKTEGSLIERQPNLCP